MKKGRTIPLVSTFSGRGTTEAFRFVWKHRGQHEVKVLCRHLNISRSGYYAWANRKPSQRDAENADLLLKVRRVYNASKGRYGSPRVYQALRREGLVVAALISPISNFTVGL
ncbi:IS3 family transposase [Billgrantia desiderata]|uniref:IS3 family transposase n=1 Tax=Billgrantia desiderata TaxID=52021 RepID=UPI00174D138A|nr:IS3 family transposase [Halomonas desiderata]